MVLKPLPGVGLERLSPEWQTMLEEEERQRQAAAQLEAAQPRATLAPPAPVAAPVPAPTTAPETAATPAPSPARPTLAPAAPPQTGPVAAASATAPPATAAVPVGTGVAQSSATRATLTPAAPAQQPASSFNSQVERWRDLVTKYFPPEEVERALWVIDRESGGDPLIRSGYPDPTSPDGRERSYGLFQINLAAHGDRISQQGAQTPEEAVRYAAQLFRDQGWGPWTVTHGGFPEELGSFAGSSGFATATAPGQQETARLAPPGDVETGDLDRAFATPETDPVRRVQEGFESAGREPDPRAEAVLEWLAVGEPGALDTILQEYLDDLQNRLNAAGQEPGAEDFAYESAYQELVRRSEVRAIAEEMGRVGITTGLSEQEVQRIAEARLDEGEGLEGALESLNIIDSAQNGSTLVSNLLEGLAFTGGSALLGRGTGFFARYLGLGTQSALRFAVVNTAADVGALAGADVAREAGAGTAGTILAAFAAGIGTGTAASWVPSPEAITRARRIKTSYVQNRLRRMDEVLLELDDLTNSFNESVSGAVGARDAAELNVLTGLRQTAERRGRELIDEATRLKTEIEEMVGIASVRPDFDPDLPAGPRQGVISDEEVAGQKRRLTKGRATGLPPGVTTQADVDQLEEGLIALARQGEGNRFWYETSGAALRRIAFNDPVRGDELARITAITSIDTSVEGQAPFILRAWEQWQSGGSFTGARYGSVGNLLERARSLDGEAWELQILEWLDAGSAGNRKIANFYVDLLDEVDPVKAARIRATGKTTATIDRWMNRSFGYPGDSRTPAMYDFMGETLVRISERMGWSPKQVQAAIWVANRMDDLVVEPGIDYGRSLERSAGMVSWESAPGKSTSRERLLAGYESRPLEEQAELHYSISKAFLGDEGEDILARALALPVLGEFDGPGLFEGRIHPGSQTRVGAGAAPGGEATGLVGREQAALIDDYAAAKGYILEQDAVPWTRPFYAAQKYTHNAVDLNLGRRVTGEEALALERALGEGDWAIVPSMDGVWVFRTVDDIDFRARGAPVKSPDARELDALNKAARAKIEAAVNQVWDNTGVSPKGRTFATDGNYIANDWSTNPNGEAYLGGRSSLNRPEVREVIDTLRRRVQAVDEEFARRWADEGVENAQAAAQAEQALPAAAPELSASPPRAPPPLDRPLFQRDIPGVNAPIQGGGPIAGIIQGGYTPDRDAPFRRWETKNAANDQDWKDAATQLGIEIPNRPNMAWRRTVRDALTAQEAQQQVLAGGRAPVKQRHRNGGLPDEDRPPTVREVLARNAPVSPEERARLSRQTKRSIFTPGEFTRTTDRIDAAQPDLFGKVQATMQRTPGLRRFGQFTEPMSAGRAQEAQGFPLPRAVVRYDIYRSIESARARASIMGWMGRNEKLLGLDGGGRAKGIALKEGVDVHPKAAQRLDDIIENLDDYVISPEQMSALDEMLDTFTAMTQRQLEAGVDVHEVAETYWARVVKRSPTTGRSGGGTSNRLNARPGHTKPREFGKVRDGITAGFDYANPLEAAMTRLDTGIASIADKQMLKTLRGLGVKPSERVPQRLRDDVNNAREWYKYVRSQMNKIPDTDDAFLELDAAGIELQRADRALRIAAKKALIPGANEKMAFGRILPKEVIDELDLYFAGVARDGAMGDFFQLWRGTQVIGDLSALLVQGTNTFYRNQPAWWKAAGYSIAAIAKDPWGYVVREADAIEEGIRYGGISPPTEYLLHSAGGGSIFAQAARGLAQIPGIRHLQNSFEWYAFVGQTELWKGMKGAEMRNLGRNLSQDELRQVGSMVRKELGVVLRPGLTRSQRRIEAGLLYAPRFTISFAGIMANAARPTTEGVEARKLIGMVLAGGIGMAIAGNLAAQGEMPNLTNPLEPGFLGFKTGEGYVYPLGPWQTYIRASARATANINNGDYEAALVDASFLARGKSSLQAGALVDFLLGQNVIGETVEFTPEGVARYIANRAGPIGPRQVFEEGIEGIERFPIRIGETTGLRTTPMSPAARRAEDLENRVLPALQEQGIIPEGATLEDLGSGEYDAAIRFLEETNPKLAQEWEQRRRERDSIFQKTSDERARIELEFEPAYQRGWDDLVSGGREPDQVGNSLGSLRSELHGRLEQLYANPEYQAALGELEPNSMRELEDRWFSIVEAVAGERKVAEMVAEDWDEVDRLQQSLLDGLDGPTRARFENNLALRDSVIDAHPLIQLKREVDERSQPYYALPEDGPERQEWLASNPDVNVGRWLFYGTALQSAEAVNMALERRAPGVVGDALNDPGFDRDINYVGLSRPINENEQTLAAWELSGERITNFLNGTQPSQYYDQEALRIYGEAYDQLPDQQQGTVRTNVRTIIRENDPRLDAFLAWWGSGAVYTLRTLRSKEILDEIMAQYGSERPSEDFVLRVRQGAR